MEIMKEPVLCTLDGRTYEKSAITAWLTQHRESPYTRKPMTAAQTIEMVLIPNRTLADSIQEFLTLYPELSTDTAQQATI